jgi:hypothetical protein
MKKMLTAALAALTFGGAVAASTTPAQAQRYGHYGYRYYGHHHDNTGAAVAAGVVGLALGAAIVGSSDGRRGYYNDGYYERRAYYAPQPYYGRPYYDAYRSCESREWGYDPYTDRRVMVTRRYAC